MDDLYSEVMSLLHDTGAFAKARANDGLALAVEQGHSVAVAEILRLANDSKRQTDQTDTPLSGSPDGGNHTQSRSANKTNARRLPRPISPSIAPE